MLFQITGEHVPYMWMRYDELHHIARSAGGLPVVELLTRHICRLLNKSSIMFHDIISSS